MEQGGKMNLHKWHKIMKHKIEEDGVRDLKGMRHHSFLAWMKGDRKKGSRINSFVVKSVYIRTILSRYCNIT